jgi:probable F420-dependent oxidoreductase
VTKATVGVVLAPQFGTMQKLRRAWEECDALGVDRIYTADHFHAMVAPKLTAEGTETTGSLEHENFEGGSIESAMAVTTRRAEIGCLVHCIAYRNPNLLADIARTVDHLSGGRYVLGLGAGYLKEDYDEYNYRFGTAGERLRELEAGIAIIKNRFLKLNPQPMRHIPLLIAGLGEKVTLRLVATHADIWHGYGPIEALRHKAGVLDEWCRKVGRDPHTIERATFYVPALLNDATPEDYLAAGFTHVVLFGLGPEWDLSLVREVLKWRDTVNANR